MTTISKNFINLLVDKVNERFNIDKEEFKKFISDFLNKEMKIIKSKEVEKAICITCGEQSENHVGMVKNGNGLAKNGYNLKDLKNIKKKFEKLGGVANLIDLKKEGLNESERETIDNAFVLVLKNGFYVLLGEKVDMMNELTTVFEWDQTYWDVRRGRELNKIARWNVCFGIVGKEKNILNKEGSIIGLDIVPNLKLWKEKVEELCDEKEFETEGNYYYNLKKTGIGFHGDGERKKVVAANICDENVKREINWVWFKNSKPFGKRIRVELENGDCYIMSEKASGFDWKKRSIATLRHAAGKSDSKYLKIKDFN